jgi:hypothetical protein
MINFKAMFVKKMASLLIILFSIINIINAQNVARSPNYTYNKNNDFFIIGNVNGNTAICLMQKNTSDIKLYNAAMQEIRNIELPFLNNDAMNINCVKTNTNIVIVYETKTRDSIYTYFVSFDKGFTQSTLPAVINSRLVNDYSLTTQVAISANKNIIALHYTDYYADSCRFNAVVFDANGTVFSKVRLHFDNANSFIDASMFVSNAGIAHIIALTKSKNQVVEKVQYFVNNKYNTQTYIVNTPNLSATKGALEFNEKLQKIMISLQETKQATSVYTITIDAILHTNTTNSIAINNIENFVNYEPKELVPLNTGSMVYFAEHSYETSSEPILTNDMARFGMPETRVSKATKYFMKGDIACIMISPDGNLLWQKNIEKTQSSEIENDATTGFAILQSKSKIVLMHSTASNKNNLQLDNVSTDGTITYNIVNAVSGNSEQQLLQQAVQLNAVTVLLPIKSGSNISFAAIKIGQ